MAMVLAGPPWGTYIDEDEQYLLGQVAQMGSGLLRGDEIPEDVAAEIGAAARRAAERLRARRAGRSMSAGTSHAANAAEAFASRA